MTIHSRVVAAVFAASLAACSGRSNHVLPLIPAAMAPASTSASGFAPYVDTTSWPPFSFRKNSEATGTRSYTMAFVQSYQSSQCEGAWAGTILPNDATYGGYYRKQIASIRRRGGDAIVAFGGASGQELGQVCTDVASLEAAYQTIADAYGFTHLDFDVEGADIDDAAATARRSEALAQLQAHYAHLGKSLEISLTLPVLPAGMPQDVVNVVKSALQAGVKIELVNVMAMDFGDGAAPHPSGRMGQYAIQAVKSSARQLAHVGFPLGSNPYASLGVTPMIGQNDAGDEVFELSDATTLLHWAKQHKIGRIAYWAAQRDKECSGGVNHNASDTCSGIVQTPGAFSKIFATY